MSAFHGTMIPMNAAHLRKLQIVVLAAGFSSRLGQPKALARVHGISLLRRTLKVASSLGAYRLMVVVPRNASRFRIEARGIKVCWAVNAERTQGLSSSVRRGIVAARYAAAVLLLPADLIYLNNPDLSRLVRRWRSAPRRLIARKIDFSGATPAILPRWLYSRAASLAGDVGLRGPIGRLPTDNRVLVELPSAAWDVDTPQDLTDARRRFRSLSTSSANADSREMPQ
jgi:molybdenum cofactor cytidylyltransferase